MTILPNSDLPSDIVKRISAAADQLYEEGGRAAFPNVDAVRRRARADMNTTSSVMRAWRKAQTGMSTPLPTSIPAAVQEASQSLLNAVWITAAECANANLQTAQAGGEEERVEAEACRQQLASAFDSQTAELMQAQKDLDSARQATAAQAGELQTAVNEVEDLRLTLARAEGTATTAQARASEITKRADDLRMELTRAYDNAELERIKAAGHLEAAHSTITQLREQFHQSSGKENTFREELAHLRGQIETMSTERQALLAALRPNGKGASLPLKRPRINSREP